MCGVVGLVALTPRRADALRADLDLMSAAVAHRGPDDEGTWIDADAGVALGHRRLSIVDLSATGHQPMSSGDGRWVLVLNGELYDHAAQRRQLESAGVGFQGSSDTEVLVELIARHGPAAALARLDGMFAVAAWDRRDRSLYLARDRMGEKPLYYGRVGETVAFASELTALRRLPGADLRPDPVAVGEYLRFGFVPAPLSIMSGVRKLPPACLLRLGPDGEFGPVEPYWSLREVAAAGVDARLDVSDRELVDLAEETLRDSIRARLVADVPVGAFLSGGLDSSTVVALAQAVSSRPVRTFTVAVGGEGDESASAAAVARHLGTEHTTLPLPELDAVALASGVATIHDEPFADPSSIPTALLCAAARGHVTVALSGDGADELLAGYNRYRVAHGGLARLRRLPRPVRAGLARGLVGPGPAAWDRLGERVPGAPPALGTKLHKLAGALSATDAVGAYRALATQWDPGELMLTPPPGAPGPAAFIGGTALDQLLMADQERTLPDNMLVKVDRASMAVALEVRVPFLQHRFVELTWRLPERAKVRDGQGKWLVRQILQRHVPASLWDRPKMGFDPPLASWLRGPLQAWARDLLAPERLQRQGILRPEPVWQALEDHESGRRNNDYRLWTVLMLESWLDSNGE